MCANCAEPIRNKKAAAEALRVSPKEIGGYNLVRGAGCEACFHTGYRGRVGIFEIFIVSNKVRSLIMSGGTEEQIRKQALDDGMRTLRDSGLAKLREGLTTVEEFVRVLG